MRRIPSTYIYMAVALVLFCFVYFIDSKMKTTDDERVARRVLFEFKRSEVNFLEINNSKGSVTMEKQKDRWRIIKPVNTPADGNTIEHALEALQYAVHMRTISYASVPGNKAETLKLWNLDPPAVHVIFKTPNDTYHFLVGRNVALSEMVYARASDQAGDPIHIINQSFKMAVDMDLAALRSRTVFDFDPLDATKFSVREFAQGGEPGRETEVFKGKDNLWAMQKPLVARTNQIRVQNWIKNLRGLHVIDFITDEEANLSAYGLDAPTYQIMMQSGPHHDETTLLVGAPVPVKEADKATAPTATPEEGKDTGKEAGKDVPAAKEKQFYAKLLKSSTIFTLSQNAVSKMIEQLGTLRSRLLMSFEPRKTYRITFESQGKTIGTRLENGYWKVEDAAGSAADESVIMHILNQFDATEINFVKDSAVDLHPYGLDAPTVKIVLQQYPSETPSTIELDLGKIENGEVYARTSMEPFVYGAPLHLLDLIPRDAMALRSLQMISVHRTEFKSLQIEQAGRLPVTISKDKSGLYQIDNPLSMVDEVKADQLLLLMEKLRAEKWLGPPLPAYGLDAPSLSLTLTTSSGETLRFRIGARLPDGGFAAQLVGQPLVGEISEDNEKVLSSDIVLSKPLPAH